MATGEAARDGATVHLWDERSASRKAVLSGMKVSESSLLQLLSSGGGVVSPGLACLAFGACPGSFAKLVGVCQVSFIVFPFMVL